jgi:alpha-galactosidase
MLRNLENLHSSHGPHSKRILLKIGTPALTISRRQFLENASLGGVCALLGQASVQSLFSLPLRPSSFLDLHRPPDFVRSYESDRPADLPRATSQSWVGNGVAVEAVEVAGVGLKISLAAEKPVSRIHLRWQMRVASNLRVLGDHWERAYGDLEWRGIVGERVMPWYFLVYDGKKTHGCGVATSPSAMCSWRLDNAGISLWLDVRNGGSPVHLGGRKLEACTIVTCEGEEGESPWQTARALVKMLCPAPRLPAWPLYGANNWYYSYGQNCSATDIERDAGFLADLTGGIENRPFQVIDDGWEDADGKGGDPWRAGNQRFPDMPKLASRLKSMGVRPGIWMRPLLTNDRRLASCALKRSGVRADQILLDPTFPEVRERIKTDLAGIAGWGYELIKHDYSTDDLFGRWGFQMGASLTDDGWYFHDRSLTNAEIIREMYQVIREGAGEHTAIIGCNTVGHLAAGLFEAQRIGDDTSGEDWNRTRKMGVNALAFRGLQHGAFFAADADCVGITSKVPWHFNQQWMDLLARSGTPFFVSVNPAEINKGQQKVIGEALRRAAIIQPLGEPIDWLDSTTPEHWRFGNEEQVYDWFGTVGDTAT